MRMKSRNFKSKTAYLKWNAYGHAMTKKGLVANAKKGRESVFASTPGNTKVSIRGNAHKVHHSHGFY